MINRLYEIINVDEIFRNKSIHIYIFPHVNLKYLKFVFVLIIETISAVDRLLYPMTYKYWRTSIIL